MATIKCMNCDQEFKAHGKRVKTAKFCSHACQKEYHSKNYTNYHYFTCEYCGKGFRRKQGVVTSAINSGETIRYCSRSCKNKADTAYTQDIECVECGSVIKLPKHRIERAENNFCSIKCRSLYNGKRLHLGYEIRSCIRCDKEFQVKVSDINKYSGIRTFEYCSVACKNGETVNTICDYCSKPFTMSKFRFDASSKHYCDVECMGKDKVTSVEVTCSYCNKKFMAQPARIGYYTNLFCSRNCRIKSILNYRDYSEELSKMNTKYAALSNRLRSTKRYLRWRKQVIALQGAECRACESTKSLQVHHSHYSLYQICKENNYDYNEALRDLRFLDPDNGIVLCKKCHMNYHFINVNSPMGE